MITFMEACEKAVNTFHRYGYYKGLSEIMDFGDAWFFSSIQIGFENNMNYDQIAIMIDKESGEFELTDMQHHYDKYYDAEQMDIPQEYVIRMDGQVQDEIKQREIDEAAEAAEAEELRKHQALGM